MSRLLKVFDVLNVCCYVFSCGATLYFVFTSDFMRAIFFLQLVTFTYLLRFELPVMVKKDV